MRIIRGRSLLSADLTRCPIETRRKKRFQKRRKNKKRGWNRWKFFPYLFSSSSSSGLSRVCWCPSFSDYRRCMRVSTCVCVCIIALSHGLTWFLNERRPPFLLLWLKFVSLVWSFSRDFYFYFFLSVRGGGLVDWHLCIPSHHQEFERAVWIPQSDATAVFADPVLFFFLSFSFDNVEVLENHQKFCCTQKKL